MFRILVNEDWYEPVASRSVLEAEYEQSILRYSKSLFPGYRCTQFNALVQSDYGSSRADMVLIDHEYRGWTIVEAELEHHSLTQHVEPQMRRLVNGIYGDSHFEAIASALPDLDRVRLSAMINTVEPDFMVVVPKEDVEWRATLANLGVSLAIVEVFADHLGRRVVTFSGDSPRSWSDGHLSFLSRDGFLPRAFRLETSSVIPDVEALALVYEGYLTTWRVVRARRATYILPNGSLDLEEDARYFIGRNGQGNLEIMKGSQ